MMNGKTFYYPIASATLITHALNNKKIRQNYKFNVIDTNFLKNELLINKKVPDKINLEKIKKIALSSNLFFFSYFSWNSLISDRISRKIKRYNPDAIIIYGGKHIPYIHEDEKLFYPFYKKRKHIDFYCYGSGETFFLTFLLDYLKIKDTKKLKEHIHNNKQYHNVLFYSDNKDLIKDNLNINSLKNEEKHKDYDSVKYSPVRKMHTEGIIDCRNFDIFTIEIIRGCPYHCTFCEYGINQKKVYYKSNHVFKKIYEEIYFLHRVRETPFYLGVADANFGIKNEDLLIFKFFTNLKQQFNDSFCIDVFSTNSKTFDNQKYIDHIANKQKIFNPKINSINFSFNGISKKELKEYKRYNKVNFDFFPIFLKHKEINNTIIRIEFLPNHLTKKTDVIRIVKKIINDNIQCFSLRKRNIITPIFYSLTLLYNTEEYHKNNNNPNYKNTRNFLSNTSDDNEHIISFFLKELIHPYKKFFLLSISLSWVIIPTIWNFIDDYNFSFKDKMILSRILKKLRNSKNKLKSLRNLMKEFQHLNYNYLFYNNEMTKNILDYIHQNKKQILNENIIF
jgi:hypothetical protein